MRSICLIRPLLVAALVFSCAATSFAKTPQPTTADQVKKLVAVLKSNASQKEKSDACRELARIGNKEAVAPLAALLPDEKLSHMARYGLETIPDSSVDKALRDAAGKLQGRPLVGVIGSIGVRRDTKAVKILTKLLHAPDNEVAQASARALGSIGNQAAADALLGALPGVSAANQLSFCEGLLRCAEAAAARGDRKEALAIYDRLREVPAPQQVRAAALRGAILTRQDGGLLLLSLALHSDDFTLVAAAVRTAQEMPGSGVTRLLAEQLAGLPADRQVLVIQTLAKRADEAALPALFAAARNGEKPVRLAAIRALAEIGKPSALPVLLDLLGDTDQNISQAAEESLAGLPGKEVDAAVMKMLADGAAARRITAMEFIVRRRMTPAIPALFDAAGSSDSKVRVTAVKKLGELAGPTELPGLLDLLAKATSSEDLEATEQALSAVSLKAANPAACVGQVEARLAQSQPVQKCALLRVLGAIGGPKALQAVRAAVNDSNAEVRAAAIRALSGWSTVDAAPDLLELAKTASNPAEKMICLRGYLAFAGQADSPKPQRLEMCRQAAPLVQKDDEKKLLLAALGSIVSAQALDLITPYLDDPGTKEEASTGIVNISDKLLKEEGSAKVAPRLIEPLDKVAQATANADLAKRAKELREQAKTKASAK
jgi:HEAT repeat protein